MRIAILPNVVSRPVGGVTNCAYHLAKALSALGHQIVPVSQAEIVHSHAFDSSDDVYTSHGIYPPGHRHYPSNSELFGNMAQADQVTAVSQWTANQISRCGAKVTVIPNGVDLDYLRGFIDEKGDYILWAKASIDPVGNPMAFVELAKRHPELRFVMTVAPSVNLPNNIRVIGAQPHETMLRYISRASVVVSTGTENNPIQLLEAMALRTPVLALPLGGIPEIDGVICSDDLDAGLDRILSNPRPIIKRGEECVRRNHQWKNIAKKYVEVYQQVKKRNTKVSVVIPHYNLNKYVSRAVESVIGQTVPVDEIIVVDDGSREPPTQELQKFGNKVKLIIQPNGGVASARNLGIKKASGDLICCLDADDALSFDFIERTKQRMLLEPRAGIVYTGMRVVDNHGIMLSDFVGERFPSLEKLAKGNFIPCANLHRKKAWERAGGYKNINPSWEDYDLWLSMLEAGFSAVYVNGPRFIYTHHKEGSRTVEAEKGKTSVLLRATVDGYHPALYGNAGLVTFVIPCYNQWEYVETAIQSALGQTYPHIEVIVIDDFSPNKPDYMTPIERKYPSARFIYHRENKGLAATRNTGILNARGGWIVPLDADDKVDKTFVAECIKEVYNTQDYAYTDFYVWHNLGQGPLENGDLQDFNPDRLKTKVPHACTILVQTEWLRSVGGYDEAMRDGWEDYELIVRLVKSGHCGKHIRQRLFYYRWRPDSMRQQAETKNKQLTDYIWKVKHPDVGNGRSLMSCCGGNSGVYNTTQNFTTNIVAPEGYTLLRYMGNKKGEMRKMGGKFREYEYSALKPVFAVHNDDILLFSPNLFSTVQTVTVVAAPPPEPQAKVNPVDLLPEGNDDLTKVESLSPEHVQELTEQGINTYARLIAMPNDSLASVVGKKNIKTVKGQAMELAKSLVVT